MAYQRGDVIELPFLIPGKNKTEVHPAIIISNQDVYDNEHIYICVMVTLSNLNECFAFELTKNMFISSGNIPDGKAKAHLMAYVLENHIVTNSCTKTNRMKAVYVDKLIDFINDNVLFEND